MCKDGRCLSVRFGTSRKLEMGDEDAPALLQQEMGVFTGRCTSAQSILLYFRWGGRTRRVSISSSLTRPLRSAPAHLAASEAFQTSSQRLGQTM
jgi:hypothetical protein